MTRRTPRSPPRGSARARRDARELSAAQPQLPRFRGRGDRFHGWWLGRTGVPGPRLRPHDSGVEPGFGDAGCRAASPAGIRPAGSPSAAGMRATATTNDQGHSVGPRVRPHRLAIPRRPVPRPVAVHRGVRYGRDGLPALEVPAAWLLEGTSDKLILPRLRVSQGTRAPAGGRPRPGFDPRAGQARLGSPTPTNSESRRLRSSWLPPRRESRVPRARRGSRRHARDARGTRRAGLSLLLAQFLARLTGR